MGAMTVGELKDAIRLSGANDNAFIVVGGREIIGATYNGPGCSPFTFGDLDIEAGEGIV